MRRQSKGTAAVLVLTAALLLGTSCRQYDIRTRTIDVPGMQTQEDVKTVSQALSKIDGIKSVGVDISKHRISVEYDSMRLAMKNIEFAIAEAGYDANDVPASAVETEQ